MKTEHAFERWEHSPSVTPRGTLVVIPGRGEHGGVYERLGRRLAFDGYVVIALSHGAFEDGGQSPDLDLLETIVAGASMGAPRPLFLAGSDSGALEAMSLAGRAALGVAAVIAAGLPIAPFSDEASTAESWDSELALRTSCPVHRDRISQDVAFQRGRLRPDVRLRMLADQVLVTRLHVPILAIHGRSDQVADPAAVEPFMSRFPQARLVLVRGGLHDILNDAHHRSVAAAMVVFLERLRQEAGSEAILTGDNGSGERRELNFNLL
jgi:alpha-beta hydrolase superfamily lysophospholipase